MGCGWGWTLQKPDGRAWMSRTPNCTSSLLIRLFRAFRWRIVFALASPVTPEVAGSSPVAPAPGTSARKRRGRSRGLFCVVSDGRKRADAHHAAIAGFVDRIELRVEGVKEFALGILRIAVLARADPVR